MRSAGRVIGGDISEDNKKSAMPMWRSSSSTTGEPGLDWAMTSPFSTAGLRTTALVVVPSAGYIAGVSIDNNESLIYTLRIYRIDNTKKKP